MPRQCARLLALLGSSAALVSFGLAPLWAQTVPTPPPSTQDFQAPSSGSLFPTADPPGAFARPLRRLTTPADLRASPLRRAIESARPRLGASGPVTGAAILPSSLSAPASSATSGATTSPASSTGTTSFDASGRRRERLSLTERQREAARRLDAPAPVRPPLGANLPPANPTLPLRLTRRGGPILESTSPLNVPLTAQQIRRLVRSEIDPFAPTGIQAGSFTLRPALEVTTGYDSNPTRIQGLPGSGLTRVAPELVVRSNWLRHELVADLRGTYTWYGTTYDNPTPSTSPFSTPQVIDRPTMDSRVAGRLDVTNTTRMIGEGRVLVGTDFPGSPNIQVGLQRFPLVLTTGATLGVVQDFNRLQVTARGTFDRSTYAESRLTDGTTSPNTDRDFDQYGGTLRVSYELKPGLRPFVEGGGDARIRDERFDRNGLQRDSIGALARVGSTFELSGKLIGEASVGWVERTYRDPTLSALSGLTIDGALIYAATPLTTLTASATTRVDELITPGLSGVLRRDLITTVDHAFRRWLIGTARVGYGLDDYVGSDRVDQRWFASVGILYLLNREVALRADVRRDWLRSNATGIGWDATLVTVGVRFRR